jgi:hypothetical protein
LILPKNAAITVTGKKMSKKARNRAAVYIVYNNLSGKSK